MRLEYHAILAYETDITEGVSLTQSELECEQTE